METDPPVKGVEVWATMRVTVDVDAVKREIGEPDPWPGDPEPPERTDEEIALDYVNGESGATIDNHITIQDISTIEAPAREA
jgi:hypothetical protein